MRALELVQHPVAFNAYIEIPKKEHRGTGQVCHQVRGEAVHMIQNDLRCRPQ